MDARIGQGAAHCGLKLLDQVTNDILILEHQGTRIDLLVTAIGMIINRSM